MTIRKTIFCSIIGFTLMISATIQAENLFPPQDYGKLNSGIPEGWSIQGNYKFQKEADRAFSISSTKKGSVIAKTPSFPLTAGKNYVLTLKFRTRNFGKKTYEKIASSLKVIFQDPDNKPLPNFPYHPNLGSPTPGQMSFPYTSVKNWTKKALSFIVPKGATNARLMLAMSNSKADDALPEIQIGNICVKELPSTPPRAILLNIPAANLNPGSAYGEAIINKDKKTPFPMLGFNYPGANSLLVTKAKVKGNIVYGPYRKIPAGIYELTVRLKIADNSSPNPVFSVVADANPNVGVLDIRGQDFQKANEFQEFKFRFLKPTGGWLNLPCYKAADCLLTIDKLTVAPLKK